MNQRNTLLCGAAMACLAVVVGAFGAHAFKANLTAMGRLETYELAVRYQFYHALALLVVGIVMNQFTSPTFKIFSPLFLAWYFLF